MMLRHVKCTICPLHTYIITSRRLGDLSTSQDDVCELNPLYVLLCYYYLHFNDNAKFIYNFFLNVTTEFLFDFSLQNPRSKLVVVVKTNLFMKV